MTETKDKNKLGIWMTTSLVIGNMIGAGIFLMPAALAGYGGISILGWLVSSVGALLLAKGIQQTEQSGQGQQWRTLCICQSRIW